VDVGHSDMPRPQASDYSVKSGPGRIGNINTLCSADPGLRRRILRRAVPPDAGRVEIVPPRGHRSLSKADTGWPDYCQLACEVISSNLWSRSRTNAIRLLVPTCQARNKDYPRVLMNR